MPAAFRQVLAGSPQVDRGIGRANRALARVHADAVIPKDIVLDIARRVVHEVGELITAGNLAVFSELAPVFVGTIAALDEDEDGAALLRLGTTLKEGPSERGGQTRLRLALNGYARARSEADPRLKAELMLLANARIGRHEQIRLQPFIAGSIDAPIKLAFLDPADEAARHLPRGLQTLCRGALRVALREASKEAERHWEELCTREMMTLQLPDETLVLGRRLPAPRADRSTRRCSTRWTIPTRSTSCAGRAPTGRRPWAAPSTGRSSPTGCATSPTSSARVSWTPRSSAGRSRTASTASSRRACS